MKKILIIGNFLFPNGNASGTRVYSNGKIFQELGYSVIVIGQNSKLESVSTLFNTKQIIDGFETYAYPYPKSQFEWMKYNSALKYFFDLVSKIELLSNLEFVVLYGSPRFPLFTLKLIKYFQSKNVKIISDAYDWLTVKTKNPVFNFVKNFQFNLENRYINNLADGVISISRYFENYYRSKGKKTIRIPPLTSFISDEISLNGSEIVEFMYAGYPFRQGEVKIEKSSMKDRVDYLFEFLFFAKKAGMKFKLNIYGLTRKEYIQALPDLEIILEYLIDEISYYGPISQDQIIENTKLADYTIFFRDVNRDTTAGFPSKLAESISCGTPLITNLTSDIGLYLRDGYNGYIIDLNEKEEALKKIISIISNKKIVASLKKNCVKSKLFYYKSYINEMNKFLASLVD